MQIVSIKAEARDTKTKASVLRQEGKIPAVLYGGEGNVHFSTTHNDVRDAIYTQDFRLTELDVDGKKYKAIVKDIQFHPVTDAIEHIDFLKVEQGRKVNVEIPIRFKGTSPGVKNGGRLVQSLRKVKVKVDPAHMVDELFIDISDLELGGAVRVKDIEFTDGMTLMLNKNIPVAVVQTPRALKSATATAAAALLEDEEGEEGGDTEESTEEQSEG